MNDGSTMLTNLMALMPDAITLLTAITSVVAVALFVVALVKFVRYSKGRDGTRLSTAILMVLAATMLWNLGASATSVLQTFFGENTSTDTLMAYTTKEGMPEQTNAFLKTLVMCVQLYGYYAFVTGWYKVTKIDSGTQSSDGAFASAFWHICGGAAAINIVATVNVISSTLGFGDVL